MNISNSIIIISRYNEDTSFINKLNDKQFQTILYEKENPNNIYNIPKNKGNEASVYLKYIIDHYDNLKDYTIFIHCHEHSWHHEGSIVDIIENNMNKDHIFTNLNNYYMGEMENLDETNTDLALLFREYIRKAVGPYKLYPSFTKGVLGCAQFIVHKTAILNHSKIYYEKLYDWLMNTRIENFWNGRFLEWTWDLFWNKCLKNIPIRKYLNESIVEIKQINNNSDEILSNVLRELNDNGCYYVNENEITIRLNNNVEYTCKNQYIYNKYL